MNTTGNNDTWLQRHRRALLTGGPSLLLLIASIAYLNSGRYVSTDDAYVQAASTEISADVSGRVIEIGVHDNQAVHRGDVLFKLDDRNYRIAVENAQAQLANARLQISARKATYRQRAADVEAAQATLVYCQQELARQKTLRKQGISSQAQLEQAQHAFDVATQSLRAAEHERENVRASLGDDPDIDVDKHPAVQQAQATLDRAESDLSDTVIKAPSDGIVAKVEQLQIGDYIKAATPVFALVSTSDIWVEANFKETDLTDMRAGQDATIKIDTYPGHTFHGKVESTSPGTGASFALLPPENASGNWVKVVQRLSVRIRIDHTDSSLPLYNGLSAVVTVDTGHHRFGK